MKTLSSPGLNPSEKPQPLAQAPNDLITIRVSPPETDDPFTIVYDRGMIRVLKDSSPANPMNPAPRPTISASCFDDNSDFPNPNDVAKELKELLTGDWFYEVCSNPEHYNQDWIELFVDKMMASTYGKDIVREWAIKKKRLIIRGNIVGMLVAAGVLEGSYLAVAKAYLTPSLGNSFRDKESNKKKIKTFAKYAGRGKDQGYYGWVLNYVNTEKAI